MFVLFEVQNISLKFRKENHEGISHFFIRTWKWSEQTKQLYQTSINKLRCKYVTNMLLWSVINSEINTLYRQLCILKRVIQGLSCTGRGDSRAGKHLCLSWTTITDSQATSCRCSLTTEGGRGRMGPISVSANMFSAQLHFGKYELVAALVTAVLVWIERSHSETRDQYVAFWSTIGISFCLMCKRLQITHFIKPYTMWASHLPAFWCTWILRSISLKTA